MLTKAKVILCWTEKQHAGFYFH